MRTIHRDIVGIFMFSIDDKILFGKGGVYKGTLLVPGGGVEKDETKLEAIERETMEETGVDISEFKVKLLDKTLTGESEKVLRETGEKVHVKMTFYNFTAYSDKPADKIHVRPGDDLTDLEWYSIKDLPKLKLSPPSITTLQNLGYL